MNIYVGNVPSTMTEMQLKTLFKKYGMVFKVYIPKDTNTGLMRGMAFVQMPCINEALEAIRVLDGHEFEGKQLCVKQAYHNASPKKGFISREWRDKAEYKF